MILRMLPKKNDIAYYAVILSDILYRLPAIVFFIWFSWFLVLLSDRSVPSILFDGRMITEHPRSDEPAIIKFSIDRSKICRVQYNQTFYDASNTRFMVPSYYIAVGNRNIIKGQTLTMGITIPRGMAPGPARYESERQYACNWTQLLIPIFAPNPTIYFNVEPK